MADTRDQQVSERGQISIPVKVLSHVLTGRAAQIVQRTARAVNRFDFGREIFQRTGAIEEPCLAILYQFWNSGDRGSKNCLAACHRFHQDERDALAAAREYDEIGQLVPGVEFRPGKMAEQFHLLLEPEVSNQVLKPGTLRSVSTPLLWSCEAILVSKR